MPACIKITIFVITITVLLLALQIKYFTIPIPAFMLKLSLQERIFWQFKAAVNTIIVSFQNCSILH